MTSAFGAMERGMGVKQLGGCTRKTKEMLVSVELIASLHFGSKTCL